MLLVLAEYMCLMPNEVLAINKVPKSLGQIFICYYYHTPVIATFVGLFVLAFFSSTPFICSFFLYHFVSFANQELP